MKTKYKKLFKLLADANQEIRALSKERDGIEKEKLIVNIINKFDQMIIFDWSKLNIDEFYSFVKMHGVFNRNLFANTSLLRIDSEDFDRICVKTKELEDSYGPHVDRLSEKILGKDPKKIENN